jgi:DNA polymerase III subunit epsilon
VKKKFRPLDKEVFVCVDCESTGLDPETDRMIEIAAAKFTVNEILEQKDALVNPECDIPEVSIAIHHITQDMCAGQPPAREVLPEFLEFIGDHPIVGHNIQFDIELIANTAKREGIPCKIRENDTIDTLRLARLYGESPTNSLEKLREHFNIADEGAHRALSDVVVNIGVFRYLSLNFKTKQQILDVLKKPIALKFMPLGKHKGRPIREMPLDYLKWAANKDFDMDLLFTLRSELKRRKQKKDFGQSTNPFQDLDLGDFT